MLNIFNSEKRSSGNKSARRAMFFGILGILIIAIPFVDFILWIFFFVFKWDREYSTIFLIVGPLATAATVGLIIAPIIGLWNHLYARLNAQAQETAKAQKEAERLLNQRTQFVAYISHEIRNPLNGIIGIADSLDAKQKPNIIEEKIDIIRRSANDLMFILNDILDMAKIDEGQVKLQAAPTSLREIINQLYEFWKTRAEGNGLRLDLRICETFPDYVNIDAQRFRQVANNLISNAIKYSDKGSVLLSADCDYENQKAMISVQDTGVGIPPDMQERIFQAYQQVGNSSHNAPEKIGTGLGLPIARRLAHMMGGDVKLISSSKAGSKFQFSFEVEPIDVPKESELSAHQIIASFEGKTALVADDSMASAIVAREHLQRLGISAQIVNSGQAAIEMMSGKSFDFALIDDNLGDMRGFEVLRQMDVNALPICIAYTGRVDIANSKDYLRMGFQGYISKPANFDAVKSEMLKLTIA